MPYNVNASASGSLGVPASIPELQIERELRLGDFTMLVSGCCDACSPTKVLSGRSILVISGVIRICSKCLGVILINSVPRLSRREGPDGAQQRNIIL